MWRLWPLFGFLLMVAGGIKGSALPFGIHVAAAKVCVINFRSIFFTTRFQTSATLIYPPRWLADRWRKH